MNNFVRSLKIALRYPWMLAAAIASALAVALLWGGNIGAVYPLVEISLNAESLPAWAERSVAERRTKVAAAEADLAAFDAAGPGDPAQRRLIVARRDAEAAKLELYQGALDRVIRPYLNFSPF